MTVILVEDEPSALRYLRSTLEMRCEGCQVVATAGNGTEALSRVRDLRPDVVITDIRMPGMNGIELAERLKREFPDVYSVIVSGYQDFEYARGALHCGVVDYLLKPVRAAELRTVIAGIQARTCRDLYDRRVEIVQELAQGGSVDSWRLRKYLPYQRAFGALLRAGGLPSRFSPDGPNARNPALASPALREEMVRENVWTIPGRDVRELVFYCAPDLTRPSALQRSIAAARDALGASFPAAGTASPTPGALYSTLVVAEDGVELSRVGWQLSALRRFLDSSIVPGISQTLRTDGSEPSALRGGESSELALAKERQSRIDFLLANASYPALEVELRRLSSAWERQRLPLVGVEAGLRQVLSEILRRSGNPNGTLEVDIEIALDEALYRASSYRELAQATWHMAQRILGISDEPPGEDSAPALHLAIRRYVALNYAASLSVASLCEKFRISQTYLNRLFHKHEGAAFVEYVTRLRMDKAKQLICESPDMPLKDVAAYVGYQDPFYFSRVFKSLTGVPPSQWKSGSSGR